MAERVAAKLMRLDRPWAKIHLKLDSSHLLIHFFDPIPAARITCRDDTIRIRTENLFQNLNLIENISNLIENG